VLIIGRLEYLIESFSAICHGENINIQYRGQHGAFIIVRDACIRRVFVRTIMLNPRIEARLRSRLDLVTRSVQDHVEIGSQCSEIFPFIEKTTTSNNQVVIIRGESFKYPQ